MNNGILLKDHYLQYRYLQIVCRFFANKGKNQYTFVDSVVNDTHI